ncbi:MAG: protein-L-isoaspartate(D-aspartate) O-methyltransferase [Pseudomonadota bacterium]|nr:protein-L-isoaspartate(D-aspartate) O-methyltransferase [Pseudomonadota bacterium]
MTTIRRDQHGLGMTSQRARDRLIERLRVEGIRDQRVLDVMRNLPRHLFVDEGLESRAYEDSALPIGLGQTISQPWIVARMTELVIEVNPRRVLEIGTGSGYQAAVLAHLVEGVFSVERIESLLRVARKRFRAQKLENIRTRHQDGHLGWPEEGPFDAIIATAAGDAVAPALLAQLAQGGVLVAPIGNAKEQKLVRVRKISDAAGQPDYEQQVYCAVSFVPLLRGIV